MSRTALAALTLAAAAAHAAEPPAPPASGKYWVYLGTYTGKEGSKGIYRSELDVKTGKLSEPELAAEVGNPSFLTISPNGKFLYAVGETSGKKGEGGGVYAYAIDPPTGKLTQLSEATSGGAGPCHVAVDSAGKQMVVANYGAGSWKYFELRDNGEITANSMHFPLKGTGPNPKRQEKPHAHCGVFDATGKYFFVVDLGTDRVWGYAYSRKDSPTNSATNLSALPPIKLPPGSGPRHIDLTAANDYAFVCGELDCTINAIKLDLRPGKPKMFEVVQSLSTLPDGKPTEKDSTAEVRIHPSEKWVYVSNRGHNSIAAFAWDGKKLSAIGHATEGIKTPRNFNVTPDGRWMLVANQDGGNVVVFEIDGQTGLPKPTGTSIAVSRPVCVKFLAKP